MFKKINMTAIALATAVAGSSAFIAMGAANAETFTRKEVQNRDVCYQARRVPATVEYNTRGIRLKGASRSWEGNMQRSGSLVRDRYNDEVFIQTKRVVEEQHMTLVPVRCR